MSIKTAHKVLRYAIPLSLMPYLVLPMTYCPFTIPWIMCHICPLPFCISRYIRNYIVLAIGCLALAVGRIFCGVMCPYGFIHEVLSKLSMKINRSLGTFGVLGNFVVRVVSWILVVLSIITILSLINPKISLVLHYPPQFILNNIVAIRMLLFVAFMLLNLLCYRLWCRICPLGQVLGIFNRISILKVAIDHRLCSKCHICTSICPMSTFYKLHELPLYETMCIRCLSCLVNCKFHAIRLRLRFMNS